VALFARFFVVFPGIGFGMLVLVVFV